MRVQVDRDFGVNVFESLQPGEVVALAGEATIGLLMGPEADSVEATLDMMRRLVTIPAGDTLEILERARDRKGELFYRSRWVQADMIGYVMPRSMRFLGEDRERVFGHAGRVEEATEAALTPIRAELFGDAFPAFNAQAIKARWRQTCHP